MVVGEALDVPLEVVRVVPDDLIHKTVRPKDLVEDRSQQVPPVLVHVKNQASVLGEQFPEQQQPLEHELQVGVSLPGVLVLNLFHHALGPALVRLLVPTQPDLAHIVRPGTKGRIDDHQANLSAVAIRQQPCQSCLVVAMKQQVRPLRLSGVKGVMKLRPPGDSCTNLRRGVLASPLQARSPASLANRDHRGLSRRPRHRLTGNGRQLTHRRPAPAGTRRTHRAALSAGSTLHDSPIR